MNSPFETEKKWILDNAHRYEGPLHMQCVINNIERRYKKIEIIKALKGRLITHTNEQYDKALAAVAHL